MINRIALNAQPLKNDVPSSRFVSRLSSPLSFGNNEDAKDTATITSKTQNPIENGKEAEPKSVETKAIEEKPAESKSVETKAIEEKPAESKSVETKAIEEKPAESKSVESKAIEEKPAESKSVESKAIEEKPVESKTAETKPAAANLDFSRAVNQFGNGFIAPLKAMFNSPTSVAVTAGVGALSIYVLKKVRTLGPLVVVAGATVGAVQTALGIKKAIQEKTVEGKEKGIYNAGQGTFALAASFVTAKSFLSEANQSLNLPIPSKEQGMFKSVLGCIKGLPKFFSASLKKVTNDDFISNSLSVVAGKTPVVEEAAAATSEVAASEESQSAVQKAFTTLMVPGSKNAIKEPEYKN